MSRPEGSANLLPLRSQFNGLHDHGFLRLSPEVLPRPLEWQEAGRPRVQDGKVEGQQEIPPAHPGAKGMPKLEATATQ